MRLLILILFISSGVKAQVYLGAGVGSYKNLAQGGIIAGVKQDAIRFQMTQIVPLTTKNTLPTVIHDLSLSYGESVGVYGGIGYGDKWLPNYGVQYFRKTWFAMAGRSAKEFKITIACYGLLD